MLRSVLRPLRVVGLLGACVAAAAASSGAWAVIATFSPSKDNSIYSEGPSSPECDQIPNCDLSNGQGAHLFAGKTTFDAARRALMKFDVASIPPGSTVTSASLRLRCTLSPASFAPPATATFTLRRLTADWGEGASDAAGPEGMGAIAAPGDATWTERFFAQSLPWSTAGGDFAAATSATFVLLNTTICSEPSPVIVNIASTAQLVSNVQAWVNNPANNFGWILRENETAVNTARRFASSEHPTASFRPSLTVQYTLPPAGPGAVPDGDDVPGVQLLLDNPGGGQVQLTWGASCSPSATDYAVYEGQLGSFPAYSHAFSVCSTAGATSATLTPSAGDVYFLVVPIASSQEGSYGVDSSNAQRPPGSPACFTQNVPGSICP